MFIMLYKVVPLYDTVLLGGTKAMSLLKGTYRHVCEEPSTENDLFSVKSGRNPEGWRYVIYDIFQNIIWEFCPVAKLRSLAILRRKSECPTPSPVQEFVGAPK